MASELEVENPGETPELATANEDSSTPTSPTSSTASTSPVEDEAKKKMQPTEIMDGATIWVPHETRVWKQAIIEEQLPGDQLRVRFTLSNEPHPDDGKVITINRREVSKLAGELSETAVPICNNFDANGVEDMCTLNHLHEPAVLRNLELRFAKQMPYTYTGQICIAVNPYQWLDLYGEDLYKQYLEKPRESLPPHPFALSSSAYLGMKKDSIDQSILVSGESGAGKTETVKIMMNHLASVSGGGARVIDQVLKSNPLLESFGNAKTKRNDNSSRFGKFAQLQFDAEGLLVGARLETYLLEKSRVVGQSDGERNYHIFYQLFKLDQERRDALCLMDDIEEYQYVKNGSNTHDIDDEEALKETQDAMQIIGIEEEETFGIFAIISAVLNMGEIRFIQGNKDDKAEVENAEKLNNVAGLLRVDKQALEDTLSKRSITAGSESYTIPLNGEQASDLRDALAKGIYSNLFDWLVYRVNSVICAKKNVKSHIGLLDIFGFESFNSNGFEQLCINYANEKLQQKFNSDVFKTVQSEYVEEGIPLTLVSYEDNQPILDLIEGRMGIVSLLNEEVLRPTATDATFVSKVLDSHPNNRYIAKRKLNHLEFTVKHYAGDVTYDGSGFLEKNRDTLPAEFVELLTSSTDEFIGDIFSPVTPTKKDERGARRSKGFLVGNTIAGAFRKQLGELMDIVNCTASQYVRCLKPNSNKSSEEFNRGMIVDQLRCAGVIAAIRISRAAFPNRLQLVEFQRKFMIICPSYLRDASPEEMVMGLLRELLPSEDTKTSKNKKFAVGKTKVYFSSGLLQHLEDQRTVVLRKHAVLIQKCMRGYCKRRQYQDLRRGMIAMQALVRMHLSREKYKRSKRGFIQLQSLARGFVQRRKYPRLLAEHKANLSKSEVEIVPTREEKWSDYSESDTQSDQNRGSASVDELQQALIDAAHKVAIAEEAAKEAQKAAQAAMTLNKELQARNDSLQATLMSNVAEYADAELLHENERLKQQVLSLQNKLVRSQEVSLISAKVVDSRITYREGRQFVEYKLQIETNTRGTLYVWHRYSTFRNLAATLQTKNGYKRKEIPELPNKQLFGNFSEKIIQERVSKLNQFLDAATHAEYLQWGIRVDQDTCVYKRRVKHPNRESMVSTSRSTMSGQSPRSSRIFHKPLLSFRKSSNGNGQNGGD